jgi:hypothetical protein
MSIASRSGDREPLSSRACTTTPLSSAGTRKRNIADFAIKTGTKDDKEDKVCVNAKQDIHGIIHLTSAQMVEEAEQEGAAEATPAPAAEGDDAKKTTAATPAVSDEEKKEKPTKKTNLGFKATRSVD